MSRPGFASVVALALPLGACGSSDQLAANQRLMQTSHLVSARDVPLRGARSRETVARIEPGQALEGARTARLAWRDPGTIGDVRVVQVPRVDALTGSIKR